MMPTDYLKMTKQQMCKAGLKLCNGVCPAQKGSKSQTAGVGPGTASLGRTDSERQPVAAANTSLISR